MRHCNSKCVPHASSSCRLYISVTLTCKRCSSYCTSNIISFLSGSYLIDLGFHVKSLVLVCKIHSSLLELGQAVRTVGYVLEQLLVLFAIVMVSSPDLSFFRLNFEPSEFYLCHSHPGNVMRTSCRSGADSIEYTSGSDALQFFGFRLNLFQIYL